MEFAFRGGPRNSAVLLAGAAIALAGCDLVLGLGDFRNGGTGGGNTGGAGVGGTTSSTSGATTASTTTGTGGGCASGLVDCGGTCTRLEDDHLNCGVCGKVCDQQTPSASSCVSSTCEACATDRADCDGSGSTGCEVDLVSDPKNCGACGHSCVGACKTSRCHPVEVGTASAPDLVGLQGGFIFWRDVTGKITRATTDGSGATELPLIGRFALNSTHIFAKKADSSVWRMSIAGGAEDQLIADPVSEIAADEQSLYAMVGLGPTYEMRVVDLATKTPMTLAPNASPVSALLPGDGFLFWFADGSAYKSGLALFIPILVVSGQTYQQGSMCADATNLYWRTGTGISTIPLSGADPATGSKELEAASSGNSLAVDSTSIYWSEDGDQVVRKAPKAGGPRTTLATSQLKVLSIAVDDTFVYWTNILSGKIMKVEKNP